MVNNFGSNRAVPVPFDASGRSDGIETTVDCVVTRFNPDCYGKPVELKTYPICYKCKAMASHSNGTASFSIQSIGEMFTVRIEDLADLLLAANAASREEPLQR